MKTKIAIGTAAVLLGVFFYFLPQGVLAEVKGTDANSGMVLIPEGPFTMGSTAKDIQWVAEKFFSASLEWYQDETPAHQVDLAAFYIDKYEVSNEEYLKFRETVPGRAPKYMNEPRFNKPRYPVVGIAWQEAVGYCRWAKKRLPTEAEWEKAARGTDGRYYPWGNDPDNTKSNVRGLEDENRYTAPKGDYEEGKSPFGVHDMAGNVWEWTSDWYQPYDGSKYESDLFGNTLKVIKGGSWHSNMDLARSAIRGKAIPYQPQNYIGFRCARDS